MKEAVHCMELDAVKMRELHRLEAFHNCPNSTACSTWYVAWTVKAEATERHKLLLFQRARQKLLVLLGDRSTTRKSNSFQVPNGDWVNLV